MVRRMVAALMRVGTGRATKEEVAVALAAGPKPAFAGEAAPPQGLTLWRVPMKWKIEETEQDRRTREIDESDEQDIHTASE
jgi:tRNA U38,U39,U40 pseudouridine synthase TruA